MSTLDTIRASVDAWNDANRQGWLACYTDDCEITSPVASGTGQDVAATFWAATMDATPDNRVTVRHLFADGDTVAEEATALGTNTGPSFAPDGSRIPPTGRTVEIRFSAIHTVRGGKIAASHFYWDSMAVIAQLGLLDASPS